MTAALVGWYVELAKLEPAFAAPGEHPEQALARAKPMLVVLVDADFEEALSDLLVARAMKRGIGLALFGSGSSLGDEEARNWARRHAIPFFTMPLDLEAFGRVLDQAARAGAPERRIAERRVAPITDRAIDGTLLLIDPGGRTWYVYDRRSGDRRVEASAARAYRAFVSPDGIERRCELDEREFRAREAATLLAQLDRSAQVPPNHSYP